MAAIDAGNEPIERELFATENSFYGIFAHLFFSSHMNADIHHKSSHYRIISSEN